MTGLRLMKRDEEFDISESDEFVEPIDRRMLTASSIGKTSKWPPTERRRHRVRGVLSRRQPDLTIILENVHDPHNVSAVLRSCDAVGILGVHVVYTIEAPPPAFARQTSASSTKWIDYTAHDSIKDCYASLREKGMLIAATAWNDDRVQLYDVDFTRPIAVAFGNEMRGLTEEAVEFADINVVIPMVGMVQSLNISVACAVTLYEAFRQRSNAGLYDSPRLGQSELEARAEEWLRK
jgi:tRNA (guanosine-2'-O-)-methyltransferase